MKQGNLDGSYGTFMWRSAIVLMLLTALVLFSGCVPGGGHNGAASQPGQQAAGPTSGSAPDVANPEVGHAIGQRLTRSCHHPLPDTIWTREGMICLWVRWPGFTPHTQTEPCRGAHQQQRQRRDNQSDRHARRER